MLPAMLLALAALALPGCFHSDDDPAPAPPVVDADPSGYYSAGGAQNGVTDVTDLQAMIAGERLIMISFANSLLYDGTITSISGNDFTADFTIYTDGENPVTTSTNRTPKITVQTGHPK
ncbi:MAG: hypothetical protein COB71_12075 [Thiotrichales bacterium]|nr:MAG: hypothetical protein COB71_12075 [Thiotrichales bacterium]